MTINYLETLPIISVFQNPSAVNQLSCSVPHGWQSFQNVWQNFEVQLCKHHVYFHWLIDPLNNLLTESQRHVGRDLWWSLTQPLVKAGHKRWGLCATCSGKAAQPLCHLFWKTSQGGVYTPSPVTGPKAASLSLLSCSWEPPLLPFIAASCSTLYHWQQEFVPITYGLLPVVSVWGFSILEDT